MNRLLLLIRDSQESKVGSWPALKALLAQQPKPAWWERLPLLRRWIGAKA